MAPLDEIIAGEIAAGGSIPFERFMDLALYHPQYGYYSRRPAIGRLGDFYTSVSVGPSFGRLLARQFYQMWLRLKRPDPFWIVEQGAHDGQLARDILAWCGAQVPGFARVLKYGVIGPAPPADVGVIVFPDWAALAREKPVGVVFSNELVDSFPVRAVRCEGDCWHERHVAGLPEAFDWLDMPVRDEALQTAIDECQVPRVAGYTTEINLRARTWMSEVARALHRGYVLTIDYGFRAGQYYSQHRTAGTLSAYVNHRRMDDVLAHPGRQDITAHVDFTALARSGAAAGLRTLALVDQEHFLIGIAHDELAGNDTPRVGIAANVQAWQTLTHPQFLGSRFFALVQAKDAPPDLDGLRFAPPWAP